METFTDIFNKNTEYRVDEGNLGKTAQEGQFSKIVEATQRYFVIEDDISNNVQYIVDQIASLDGNDNSIFPFHYFMVCIAGTKQLFTSPRTVRGEKVLQTCTDQRSKLTLTQEQRTQRIRFLHELNSACNLGREDRSRNWNLFLSVHGTRIQSKEECELWGKILYDGIPENGNVEANEDIPTIELTLLCLERLRACLPDGFKTLYCYHPGSFMHQGGFAKFLKQRPDVLNACVQRIAQRDWTKYRRKYLLKWANPKCDQAAIWALCNQRANLIRWGTISENLNSVFESYCKAAYSREQEEPAVLAEQAEKLLNQGADYKIALTDLPWL